MNFRSNDDVRAEDDVRTEFMPFIQSQYSASTRIISILESCREHILPDADIVAFFDNIFNIATAVGYGLDIWGNIVGVSRDIPRFKTEYPVETIDDVLYSEGVPAPANATDLKFIGGKTVVWNQLGTPPSSGLWHYNRCTVTTDSDTAFTATCTSNAYAYFTTWQGNATIKDHVYLYACEFKFNTTNQPTVFRTIDSWGVGMNISDASQNTFYTIKTIVTATSVKAYNIDFELVYASASDVTIGDTFSVKNYMLIDLTLLYGAGNEPSTVEEFQQMFPASYYPYNEGTLLSAGVTSVVSQGYNLFDKSTAKLGYFINGNNVSAPANNSAHSDYIAVSPNQTYYLSANRVAGRHRWFEYDSDKNVISKNTTPANGAFTVSSRTCFIRFNMLLAELDTVVFNVSSTADGTYKPYKAPISYPIPAEIRALEGYGWSCPDHYNYIDYEAKKYVQNVGNRAYASGDESDSTVVTDMTTTYYPLTTAVETDISAYLTDDNLINVEAGGTITFENQNDEDYRIPVPVKFDFLNVLKDRIILSDEDFRRVLYFKAGANIMDSTLYSLNYLLKKLYPDYRCFVRNANNYVNDDGRYYDSNPMEIEYVFIDTELSDLEKSIFSLVGAFGKGAGVHFNLSEYSYDEIFGFYGSELQPFDQGVFYQGTGIGG